MYIPDANSNVHVRGIGDTTAFLSNTVSAGAPDTAFRTNPIVYAAIRYIVAAAQTVPVELRSADGTALRGKDAKFERLLMYPNRFQTIYDLLADVIVNYNVFGEAYIAFVEKRGVPDGIYALPPTQVFHAIKDDELVGYVWQKKDGTRVPFLIEDVASVYSPNIKSDVMDYSMPPLLPAMRSVRTDDYASQLLESFFEHGTIAPGMLTFNFPLDEDTVRELQERWGRLFTGSGNWFAPLVVDNGGEWKEIGLQIRDLEALRSIDSRDASTIVSVLGVPISLISGRPETTQSTYSNKSIDREMFYTDTLLPLLNRIALSVNRVLDARGIAGHVYFNVGAAPGLAAVLRERFEHVRSTVAFGAATFGEMREAIGLPASGIYDDWRFIPLNGITVDASGKPKFSVVGTNVEAPQDVEKETPMSAPESGALVRAYGTYDKTAYADFVLHNASRYELDVFTAAESPMTWEEREVVRIVADYYPDEDDTEDEKKRKRAALYAALERLMLVAAVKQWSSALKPTFERIAASNVAVFNMRFGTSVDVVQYLSSSEWRNYVMTFADPLTKTAHDELKALIETALRDGYSEKELTASLQTLFRQWAYGDVVEPGDRYFAEHRLPSFRRAAIARTEVVRVHNASTMYAAMRSGAAAKEWIAKNDNKTRHTHRIGRTWGAPYIVPIYEPFIVGGAALMYPGDPAGPPEEVVNCRCVAVPVFESEV